MPPKIPLLLSHQLSTHVNQPNETDATLKATDDNTDDPTRSFDHEPDHSPDHSHPPSPSHDLNSTPTPSLTTFQELARIADADTTNPIETAFQERIRSALRGYVRSVVLPPAKR